MITIVVWVILIIIAIGFISSLLSAALGIVNLAITILLWMAAGFLAGKLLRGRGYGPLGNVLLGLVGGIVGSIVLGVVGLGGLSNITFIGTIFAGVVGSIILVFLVRLLADENFAK